MVVWLHDVEGYTHAEIGALLGGTASLSKSQLARAHARLRRAARTRWSDCIMHARIDELLSLRERLQALPPAPESGVDAWPAIQRPPGARRRGAAAD